MSTTSPPVNVNGDEGDTADTQLLKLREEIIEQRNILSKEECKTIYHTGILKLTEKEEEYDLIFEKQRVESVVRAYAEIHSPYTLDCPICLETISFTSYNSWTVSPCCGGGMCFECSQVKGYKNLKCCPLCRGTNTEDDNIRLAKLLAEKGHPLFQVVVGRSYVYGRDGYPVDVIKGFKLINLAAEQRYPIALYVMGILYRGGVDQFVPQSDAKAIHFLKEAANLGFTDAMGELASLLGNKSMAAAATTVNDAAVDSDVQNAVLYTTLAYSQGSQQFYKCVSPEVKDGIGAYNMGLLFLNAANISRHYDVVFSNLSKSQLLYRAKHYLEEAAMMDYEGADCRLAHTLLDIALGDRTKSLLVSYGPRIFFWSRKAAKGNRSKSEGIILSETMESLLKKICAACLKTKTEDSTDDQFKRCSRCKSIWYCSKDCQVKHWNAGHKTDCISIKPK